MRDTVYMQTVKHNNHEEILDIKSTFYLSTANAGNEIIYFKFYIKGAGEILNLHAIR